MLKRFLLTLRSCYTSYKLFAIAFLLFFAWLITFGDKGIWRLHRLYTLEQEYTRDIKRLETERDGLRKEIELLKDDKYVERIIREELGYIKDGEVVFKLIHRGELQQTTPP